MDLPPEVIAQQQLLMDQSKRLKQLLLQARKAAFREENDEAVDEQEFALLNETSTHSMYLAACDALSAKPKPDLFFSSAASSSEREGFPRDGGNSQIHKFRVFEGANQVIGFLNYAPAFYVLSRGTHNLTAIHLAACQLRDQHVVDLASALMASSFDEQCPSSSLKIVDVSRNPLVAILGAKALLQLLMVRPSIQTLDVSGTTVPAVFRTKIQFLVEQNG